MRIAVFVALMALMVSSVAVAGGFMERDSDKVAVQGFAPDGTLSQLLTVNSVTFDMSKRLAYGVYAPSAGCKVRSMATSAKGANVQRTVIDGQVTVRVVNRASPFVNFSGCTAAEIDIQ